MSLMRSLFPLLHGNHPLENGDPTVWLDYKQQIPKLERNHCVIGFYELTFTLLHTYHPFSKRGHTVWMDYKQQFLKFSRNHWGNGFYEVPFPLLHTNLPFGKWGPHSLNGLQGKNPKFARNHGGNGFYDVSSQLSHTNHPLEKQGPHSYGSHAKYSEIYTRSLGQWVWWGPFFHYYTQTTPWKTGTTQFDWITSNKLRNLNVITVSMGFMSSLLHYYIQITSLQMKFARDY